MPLPTELTVPVEVRDAAPPSLTTRMPARAAFDEVTTPPVVTETSPSLMALTPPPPLMLARPVSMVLAPAGPWLARP